MAIAVERLQVDDPEAGPMLLKVRALRILDPRRRRALASSSTDDIPEPSGDDSCSDCQGLSDETSLVDCEPLV